MGTDQTALSFEQLTEARRSLQDFCRLHVPSLAILRQGPGPSFLFHPDEPEAEFADGAVHNLTTTATCIASLDECPPRFWQTEIDLPALKADFSNKALLRPNKKWRSEESAAVYCRCRALPMVINGLAEGPLPNVIEKHVAAILFQLRKQPERFGIGEADPKSKTLEDWYPPNAFHTYWTLEILERLKTKSPNDYSRLAERRSLDLARRRDGMLLWARNKLGHQLGLHSSTPQSSLLDSDQLAWSLAIFLRFDGNLTVNLENRDFIKQGFKCLFSTQVDGTWRHYKPLFHYKRVGNAYCYVFETFAALLQSVFREGIEGEMIRELLAPYCENLLNLWRHANSTKIELSRYTGFMEKLKKENYIPNGKEIGWCSGHRVNFINPESWATASVFSYTQLLRRLVGIWCRERSPGGLNTPQNHLSSLEARKEMTERGDTWGTDKLPVSEQLQTLFANPVRMHDCNDLLEPDSRPIEKTQARSAILFGPPGTSKTTLVRFLADVIGWKYVELHASHFVAEGLGDVQKTADKIFKQLLELDHTVVLFDEIDELVRERDMEKDAFGRFLTTSMLPKLAQLWEVQKIIYFVATNHINYFDSAIIRSHRFDALIFVSPPSFSAKKERLKVLLKKDHSLADVTFQIEIGDIESALNGIQNEYDRIREDQTEANGEPEEIRIARWREETLIDDHILAKYALLRFDELNEFAYHLATVLKIKSSKEVSRELFVQALMKIADTEWRKNKSYIDYLRDARLGRRDYQMRNAWEVISSEKEIPGVRKIKETKWLAKPVDSLEDIKINGYKLTNRADGYVGIQREKVT